MLRIPLCVCFFFFSFRFRATTNEYVIFFCVCFFLFLSHRESGLKTCGALRIMSDVKETYAITNWARNNGQCPIYMEIRPVVPQGIRSLHFITPKCVCFFFSYKICWTLSFRSESEKGTKKSKTKRISLWAFKNTWKNKVLNSKLKIKTW